MSSSQKRDLARLLFVGLIMSAPFILSTLALGDDETLPSFDEVKSVLNDIPISRGPDPKMKVRSLWGPELYKRTVDAAVLVLTVEKDAAGQVQITGSGSGAVISKNGHIVTNWHVIWPHSRVLVVRYPGPGRSYSDVGREDIWVATVLKADQTADLALLQLTKALSGASSVITTRNFIELEDPNVIEIGQDVFAIGHPEGLHWTYTEGVVSQIRPRYTWEIENLRFQATVIQTQTLISFGSSGGPLINRNGKLVGVISNGMLERPGLNFAISVHELNAFLSSANH